MYRKSAYNNKYLRYVHEDAESHGCLQETGREKHHSRVKMPNLPRYMALKSAYNNKYLRYVHEDVESHGCLQVTGDQAVSAYSRIEMVPAKNRANKGLFHIRSCYNNKFWTRDSFSANVWWITATADQPLEDKLNFSCTLFEPSLVDPLSNVLALRLRHVHQLKNYVSIYTTKHGGGCYESCLMAEDSDKAHDSSDIFTVYNSEARILPKKVIFRGGDTPAYIKVDTFSERRPYMNFDGFSDFRHPSFINEVFYTDDGKIRIKSDHNGKFWRRGSDSWIFAGSDSWIFAESTEDAADTLFLPVEAWPNMVSLLNLGNNNYCSRSPLNANTGVTWRRGSDRCRLNANTPTLSPLSYLNVDEPIESRIIYDVQFQLKDARIYNQIDVSMASEQVSNPLGVSQVFPVAKSFTNEWTSTWNSNAYKSLRAPTEINKTGVPLISEGGAAVEVLAEFEGELKWGSGVTRSSGTIEWSDSIIIPPKNTVMVHVMATRGKCDVPFSYKQRDTLTNREEVVHALDDGIYTGVNCYNFKTKVVTITSKKVTK